MKVSLCLEAYQKQRRMRSIASNDRAIAPEQEISTAKRMGAKTLTLASSHLPMLSHPEQVADFVIEAQSTYNLAA
jgi:hypothetical protein